ncbi:MAG: chloride channel protein, partial [Pseudonocardiaceae bacterium]
MTGRPRRREAKLMRQITGTLERPASWLRGDRFGLFFAALVVGVGAGFGAVGFRYLIYGFTWLATGHPEFGQLGRVASAHLPWLGIGFFVLVPVLGGLLYGPLIHLFAREARGHGVPEVMIAVAENGGRIRPQVSLVKAVASALCIGVGGSVGREGPIVQIGSAMASAFGQRVRMPENRLRILVACGAAGGISATFNAPITGVFFAMELILREFSIEAIFTVMLSSMIADVVSQAFLGSAPFFTRLPPGIGMPHTYDYLLVTALAVLAALIGLGFSKILYTIEDRCDQIWGNRPEWARPAVGGILLGLLLLAIPQLYGVGYPVMYQALAGNYAIWFLLILAAGKIVAASLTIGIGGSGGVFAPSLFIGAASGMAFGEIVEHLAGPAAGTPALYAVVGMGAVFAAAARGPLTALASVVEMTGDFTLTLPIMLAVAISTLISRALSYGTIYTTKLLRRGTDIDRPSPRHAFSELTVADAMHPLATPLATTVGPAIASSNNGGSDNGRAHGGAGTPQDRTAVLGPITRTRQPQLLFANESLAQALRQLVLFGRDGLPVISTDGQQLQGWITNQNVLRTVAAQVAAAEPAIAAGQRAAEWADPLSGEAGHDPHAQLPGYQIIEYTLGNDSAAAGRTLDELHWPPGQLPVSIIHDRRLTDADPHTPLTPGDRINVLVPVVPVADATTLP